MARVRTCGKQCHSAKGDRCKCWCGGAFHGQHGLANRRAVMEGAEHLLEEHGFVKGETRFIANGELPLDKL